MEIILICDMYNDNKTEISGEKYQSLVEKNIDYIDRNVFAKIDRPLGSKPIKEHPDFVYELNYGYIPNTLSGDGEELDCYIVGVDEPIDEFEGKCIAIIHRINEDDDKLILAPDEVNLSSVDIQKAVYFSEKHHKSFLFVKSENHKSGREGQF